MSTLFLIDEKKKIILHPEAYKLCPELNGLSEEEILFIILAFDYRSIYRQYPERQKLVKSIFHVWGDNKPELLEEESRPKRIKLAIEAYKSLQYNRNEETVSVYLKKIAAMQESILTEDNPTKLKNLRESIAGFKKDIKDLESEILEASISEFDLMGDKKLSWLEQKQTNMKHYNSIRFGK